MWLTLCYLYLATVVLCIEQPRVENVDEVKKSFHYRRAVDGRRGRKYFTDTPYDDGSYDSYDLGEGDYNPDKSESGFSNIRSNVPGEPGVDYPAYSSAPRTRFSCQGRVQGYYADEEAGCQAFHVCHNVVVSSFVCPVGSIFSQKLLTCDWWNKVDCSTTKGFVSQGQRTYKDNNEMVQKAYSMIRLPEINGVKKNSEVGVTRIKTVNIGFTENTPTSNPGRGSFAPITQGKVIQNFKPTNFEFRRNKDVFTDGNRFQQNINKFNPRPEYFEAHYPGQSLSNNRAKDSSITYIQNNFGNNYQDRYTTLRPSTLNNYFPNAYQQNGGFFGSKFQSSYAPTVPTVTTTTRKLYSPTVPPPTSPTYRASTISYDKYDQDLQNSDHLYTHSRKLNLFTTESTINYETSMRDVSVLKNTDSPQNDASSRDGKGLSDNLSGNMKRVGSSDQEKAATEVEINLQSGGPKIKGRNISSIESNFGNNKSHFGTGSSGLSSSTTSNRQSYRHFYTDLISMSSQHGQRDTLQSNGVSARSTDGTLKAEDEGNSNSDDSESRIPPLFVQIPRPTGSSGGVSVVDIADQLFSFDSLAKMSTSTTQSAPLGVASKIDSTARQNNSPIGTLTSGSSTGLPPALIGIDSVNVDDPIQAFDFASKIPPLIPQSIPSSGSQSVGSLGISSSNNDDDPTRAFESATGIAPLIPQASQSASSPGIDSTSANDPPRTFESPSRIPPLIPQSAQSIPSSGSQSIGSLGIGSSNVDDPTRAFESPTGIAPLIPQALQSASSPGIDSASINVPLQTFESPSRIPPLIPQDSQSTASSGLPLVGALGISSTNDDNDPTKAFESATGIAPLIPQASQSASSQEIDSTSADDPPRTFESPSGIPPLIPQNSQSTASSGSSLVGSLGISSTNDDNDPTKAFESATGIAPLIPQALQSASSPGIDSASINDPLRTFESPSRIPPLIPQGSPLVGSLGTTSNDDNDPTKAFESATGIAPLIPQALQSASSPGIDSASVADPLQTFESSSGIPPLIPQILQSTASSGSPLVGSLGIGLSKDDDDPTRAFESATGIAPLIPQAIQSASSPGIDSASINDPLQTFESPSRIPPLISQVSPSTASSGSPLVGSLGIGSTIVDDDPTRVFESATGIAPLIPQALQSASSPGIDSASVDDPLQSFESPSRIPPLIPQFQQSTAPSGSPPVGSSGISASNNNDPTRTFGLSTEAAPSIPQVLPTAVWSGTDSANSDDPLDTFESGSRIPPLIPQVSQSTVAASGSPLVESLGMGNDEDPTRAFESATGIAPLIPQTLQSASSSGIGSASVDDPLQTFESPSRIPPLIPLSLPSAASSGSTAVGSSVIESANFDDPLQTFESPSRITPLIPQFPQSTASSGSQSIGSSGITASNNNDPTRTFGSSTEDVPLIPQALQSAVSSGIDSAYSDDPLQTFESPSRIPPLISQVSQSIASSGSPSFGSSGISSSNLDDPTSAFESATGIAPLIPQSLQSVSSNSASVDDPLQAFESPSRIPPLISPVSQSIASSGSPSFGSSGIGSSNVDDPTSAFESATGIAPLIPQSLQSVSSNSASVDDPLQAFESPSKIPPLISPVSQSIASSGSPSFGSSGIGSSNVDDPTSAFESATGIAPLIPQSLQSVSSNSASVDDSLQAFESPSRIPPLISPVSQSIASSGSPSFGSSGIGSSNVDDPTSAFESATGIAPLIPQSLQSVSSDSANVDALSQTFGTPSKIPPLILQFPQTPASSGSQSVGPFGTSLSNVDDPTRTFGSSTEAPPLFSQPSQSAVSSGIDPLNVDDPTRTFESPSSIPPLFSQSSPSAGSSQSQFPNRMDDKTTLNSPPTIPPQMFQSSNPVGSTVDSSNNNDQAQSSESSVGKPPSTDQSSQSATSEVHSPNEVDKSQTFYVSSTISPLVSQSVEYVGSSGGNSLNTDDHPQTNQSSPTIPSIILQTSVSTALGLGQYPSEIHGNNKIYLSATAGPSVAHIQQSFGTVGANPSNGFALEQTFKSYIRTPQLITQTFQSIGSSDPYSTYGVGRDHTFYTPPSIPPHYTRTFKQKPSSYLSTRRPSVISQPSQPVDFKRTNSDSRYNPLPSEKKTPHFTYQGQYQRPLPFSTFRIPTERPKYQFAATPATVIPTYGYGLRRSTDATTVDSMGQSADSTTKKFRINVPDLLPTEPSPTTQSTTPSTLRYPYLSNVRYSGTSGGRSPTVDSVTEISSIASSHVNRTSSQVSEVVPQFPTADHPQLSVTDRPNRIFTLFPQRNHSYFQSSIGNDKDQSTDADVKVTTVIPSIGKVYQNNYNLFKQTSVPISPTPDPQKQIPQEIGFGDSRKYYDDLRFTIRGSSWYPTATPSPPFNTISSTYRPESTGFSSNPLEHKVFGLKYPTVSKSSTQSTSPNVVETASATPNFVPTSSQSPFDNSGYAKKQFEFSTPPSILHATNIKSAGNFDTPRKMFAPTNPPEGLPEGFERVEASLNNNDSPYEFHITVNGDEDFNPSGDLISKLLAQHGSDPSLGLTGLEGYEIIKSDESGDPARTDPVKPPPVKNIESSTAPTITRTLFDVRGDFADLTTEPSNVYSTQNSNFVTPSSKPSETHAPKIEVLKSEKIPQPFFSGNVQDANFKPMGFSTINGAIFNGNVRNGQPYNLVNFANFGAPAKDINVAFEPIFQEPSPISPPRKEEILEELNKYFGQPLYSHNSQRYISPEPSRNVYSNAEQRLANLQQYRVGKNDVAEQKSVPTSSVPPTTSTTTTTTTTTPKPVKTFVQTEFIPSLSFSFDSDEGREEYVEAILKGLFADNQSGDSTDEASFFRVARENLKSKNNTTET